MNKINNNDWSFLEEQTAESRQCLGVERQMILAQNETKKARVLRHLESNPDYPLDKLVKKFSLDWDIKKEAENGIHTVAIYTGADANTEVLVLHMTELQIALDLRIK